MLTYDLQNSRQNAEAFDDMANNKVNTCALKEQMEKAQLANPRN